LLARIYKRAEQGYSFAFWLKNLQTSRWSARIFKPKGEQPFFASARSRVNEQAKLR
jgi:hypothetical protein